MADHVPFEHLDCACQNRPPLLLRTSRATRLTNTATAVEPLEARRFFSATLQINATADGDTFTLVQSGNVVNLYHNQPTTGSPEASVPATDLSSVIINGVGSDTVHIDLSGGNPIPADVEVNSGTIAFDQNLGAGGKVVDVAIASGATVNFNAVQSLNAVSVQPGATFTLVVPPTAAATASVAATAPVEVAVSTQVVADDQSASPDVSLVANVMSTDAQGTSTATPPPSNNGCPIIGAIGGIANQIGEIAVGTVQKAGQIVNAGHLEPVTDSHGNLVGYNWVWNF